MPNLHEVIKSLRSSILSLVPGSSWFLALYGSAGLSPVFVFEKDILEELKVFDWGIFALRRVLVSGRTGLIRVENEVRRISRRDNAGLIVRRTCGIERLTRCSMRIGITDLRIQAVVIDLMY